MNIQSNSQSSAQRIVLSPASRLRALLATLAAAALLLNGCTVGPKYSRPSAAAPAAYKELTPADYKTTDGWKVAQPADTALKGQWWLLFNDPELNELEAKVDINNQNIAASFAAYTAARALVKQARSQYFPTVSVGPSITNQRSPILNTNAGSTGTGTGTGTTTVAPGAFTEYSLPFDATWVPDLWGRVRNQVRSQASAAQASEADLENVRLTAHAEVAVNYYTLRGQDELKQLLDDTVVAYQQSLELTRVLYQTGIDSDEAVAQAETQLETTQAAATNLGIARAQYEHAIALLVGEPPSTFSIPVAPLKSNVVAVPYGVPSQLLERRPDIAASERTVEQNNALVGVAYAAYYPTVTLSASAGLTSTSFTNWFTWPSRFWSVGPSATETIYDGGLRRATVLQYRAQYDESVANYRETVLTAFQQVEDNLASLRILSVEIQQQDTAVGSANRALTVATDRYKLGIDPYLNVITAQTTLLSNKQTAVNLRIQQMTSNVQLIEALGGGWDSSQLPSKHDTSTNSGGKIPAPPPSTNPPSAGPSSTPAASENH
jgi:NodT family efflux transporter outer membrane factor (OMF) lipoprotein